MNKLNKDVLIKSLILMGFILLYLFILAKDKLKLYVHPSYTLIIISTIILLLIILVFVISDLFTINIHKVYYKNYLVFILTLIIIITSQVCSFKNLSYDNNIIIHSKPYSNHNINNLTFEDNIIQINKNNFVYSLDEILTYPYNYEGMNIKITGFIYKDKNLTDDQFIIARYMMVCCASNMQIAGIKCESNTLINYPEYTWVEVTGTIHTKEIPNIDTIILTENIKEVNNPDTSYVYP